jgi:hypothetical protein
MKESKAWKVNGFLALVLVLLLYGGFVYFIVIQPVQHAFSWPATLASIVTFLLATILASGFTVVQPNLARVVIFFGRYLGSVRESGF